MRFGKRGGLGSKQRDLAQFDIPWTIGVLNQVAAVKSYQSACILRPITVGVRHKEKNRMHSRKLQYNSNARY